MITAVIIDDEPLIVKNIEALLMRYCPLVQILGTAHSAESGKMLIEATRPQLVLLDIEMPFGTGFDLLKSLGRIFFEVIIITAFSEYAITAFKHSAIDYILKPIDPDELREAINKAAGAIDKNDTQRKITTLFEQLERREVKLQKLALPTMDGLLFVALDSIMYCKSDGNYTTFYFNNNTTHLASKRLNEFESFLPSETFLRIHNEYIVNINYVYRYTKGRGGNVILENGTCISVSVRKKDDFFKRILKPRN